MSGGGGKTQTTTTNSAPWSAQQPYLKQIFGEAKNLYGQGAPAYYPGNTVAPFSPETNQALDLTSQRAIAGSPINDAAQNELTKTISGGYLNSNPYLDSTFDHAAGKVRSAIDSQFSKAGRYGSGAHAGQVTDAYSGLANDIYGGNYANERANQLKSISFAPTLANQDYYDFNQLANVGAQKENMAQDVINADIAKHNYNVNAPYNNLSNYAGLIQGNYGNSATTMQPLQKNMAGGILGGAAAGAGLGAPFGPWGMGIGALGGGLLGGFA